jgi:hypothetical protein
VARLIGGGLHNREIAEELGIAERTADTHVGNVLNKLGMSSRAQIAAWVGERGWLRPERPSHRATARASPLRDGPRTGLRREGPRGRCRGRRGSRSRKPPR